MEILCPNRDPKKILGDEGVARRTLVAFLPLLRLNRSFNLVATPALMLYEFSHKPSLGRILFIVQGTALEMLFPKAHKAAALTWGISNDLVTIWNEEGEKRTDAFCHLICFTALSSTLFSNRSECWAVAICSQAAVELRLAAKQEGRIEALGLVCTALFRLSQTAPHIREIRRPYATQEQVDGLAGTKDLGKALENADLRNELRDVQIRNPTGGSNVRFTNCRIKGDATKSVWNDCLFDGCDLRDSCWNGATFNRVIWAGCDLTRTQFNQSLFQDCTLWNSKLQETNFFGVEAVRSLLIRCNLTDTFLLGARFRQIGCSPNRFTKPVVGLTWYYPEAKMMGELEGKAIVDNDALVLRLDHFSPRVDPSRLRAEVESLLPRLPGKLPLPQELLKAASDQGEIGKLRALASEAMDGVQGLVIPGGGDVERLLGGISDQSNRCEDDLRMSMFQFALLEQFDARRQVEGMGICRGSQLFNIWRGGTLQDLGDWDHGRQLLMPETWDERPFLAYAAHRQACDALGDGIEPRFRYGDLVKAYRAGRFEGWQVHPEIYIWERQYGGLSDPRNRGIWHDFVERIASPPLV